MKFGELAHRADVGIDTVRYCERQGLLSAPMRLASGYRRYDLSDVARLRFVRRAKALGFTLAEIRELPTLSSACLRSRNQECDRCRRRRVLALQSGLEPWLPFTCDIRIFESR